MNRDLDERIRERAYAIWEEEGQPEGEDFSHWLRAVEEIRTESAGEGEQQPPTLVAAHDEAAQGASTSPKQSQPADEDHGHAPIVAGPEARAAASDNLHAAPMPGAAPAPTAQGSPKPAIKSESGRTGEKSRKLA